MKDLATVNFEAVDTLKDGLKNLKTAIEAIQPSKVYTLHAQYNNLQVVKQYYTVIQAYLRLLDAIERLEWVERQIINK
jgi:hypothetical protein